MHDPADGYDESDDDLVDDSPAVRRTGMIMLEREQPDVQSARAQLERQQFIRHIAGLQVTHAETERDRAAIAALQTWSRQFDQRLRLIEARLDISSPELLPAAAAPAPARKPTAGPKSKYERALAELGPSSAQRVADHLQVTIAAAKWSLTILARAGRVTSAGDQRNAIYRLPTQLGAVPDNA